MKTFTLVASAAIAVACLSSAVPAVAVTRHSPIGRDLVEIRVSTRGLDLGRPADRRILDARIRRAADQACLARGAELSAQMDAARCRAEMIGDGASRVAALLQRRTVELASTTR